MMRLAFDIGNSAVKLGLFDGSSLKQTMRVSHASAELAQAVADLVRGRAIAGAAIASVVPEASRRISAVLKTHKIRPFHIRHDVALPFQLAYRTPETLGPDRIAAAAAAWLLHAHGTGRSVLAIDAGTALTCDVVEKGGAYLGGIIAPGPVLMQRALNQETAQLPEVPLEVPESVIGRSTVEAIQAGTIFGFIDVARGMLYRISERLEEMPIVVLTGGWAAFLGEHLDHVDAVEPHLVLDGVRLIAEKNTHD